MHRCFPFHAPRCKTALRWTGRVLIILLITLIATIAGTGFWYQLPVPEGFKIPALILWGVFCLGVAAGEFSSKRRKKARIAFIIVLTAALTWWISITPSNDRIWADDLAHTVTGTIKGNIVTLQNVRNFNWRTRQDYDQKWESRDYDLTKLQSVDLFLSTWGNPDIAHTLISFGFAGDHYVTFSFEIRKEHGEAYSPIAGFFKQYELALIAADENDIIRTRTNVRKEAVSLYRVQLSPEQGRRLFLSYVTRGNELAKTPVYYNTLTSNCTTVVFDMTRVIVPGIPMDYRVLISGRLPGYIYDQGGFGTKHNLADIIKSAPITDLALGMKPGDNYSTLIRTNLPD